MVEQCLDPVKNVSENLTMELGSGEVVEAVSSGSLEDSPRCSLLLTGDQSRKTSVCGSEEHEFLNLSNEILLSDSDGETNFKSCLESDPFEMGWRNPGSTGLTMKEYEEQLKKLTQDNFNLKLRVYFLEERLGKVAGIGDKEELVRKNIELKVTCEKQSKELSTKQELLYEASQAFEQLQREHKDETNKLRKEKIGLEANIIEMEQRLASLEQVSSHENCARQIAELESQILNSEDRIRELKIENESFTLKLDRSDRELEQKVEKFSKLEADHSQACMALKRCIKRVKEVTVENERLRGLLKPGSRNDVTEQKQEQQIEALVTKTDSLDCLTALNYVDNDNQIQILLGNLKEKELQLAEYEKKFLICNCDAEEKIKKITNLENEVVVLQSKINDRTNDEMDTIKQKLTVELAAKEAEIQKLRSDLKKRTYNLQELVNKELWDKNKQIEKLEKRSNSIQERYDVEVSTLNKELAAKEHQLKLLQDKVRELSFTNSGPLSLLQAKASNRHSLPDALVLNNFVSFNDLGLVSDRSKLEENEKSESFRKELSNVCSLLTGRLEELAGFLDSLLTNRDLVCDIGSKKRQAIKQAVDKSRELSKNLSLSINGQSFMNISSILQSSTIVHSDDDSFGDVLKEKYKSLLGDNSNISQSRDKLISEQTAIISKLRNQLKILNHEVKLRDIELSLYQNDRKLNTNNSMNQCNDKSDPCGFISNINNEDFLNLSIPELNLSEGIGCENKVPEEGRARKGKAKSVTNPEVSESEAWSEPDRSVSLARMGLFEDSSITIPIKSIISGDTSDEETIHETTRSSGKRTRAGDLSEVRRLQFKLKIAEENNDVLKAELKVAQESKLECETNALMQCDCSDKRELEVKVLLEKLRDNAQKLELYELSCKETEAKLIEAIDSSSTVSLQLKEALQTISCLEDQISKLKDQLNEKEENIKAHQLKLLDIEKKICEKTLEFEIRSAEALKQKDEAETRTEDVKRKLKEAEDMRVNVELRISEIERKIINSRTIETETADHIKEAEARVVEAERIMEEAERMKVEAERKTRDVQNFVEWMKREVEDKLREAERRFRKAEMEKEGIEQQVEELKMKLQEAEVDKYEVELKVKEGKERIQWMEEKLKELEVALDQCSVESRQRIMDIEKRADTRVVEIKRSKELLENKLREVEATNVSYQLKRESSEQEHRRVQEELFSKLNDVENQRRDLSNDLTKQIDELRVTVSSAELEIAKLANEKLTLEDKLKVLMDKETVMVKDQRIVVEKMELQLTDLQKNRSDLMSRLEEIESTNTDLVRRLTSIQSNIHSFKLESPPASHHPLTQLLADLDLRPSSEVNGNVPVTQPSEASDYLSLSEEHTWNDPFAVVLSSPRRNLNNSSPDLGIESDQGRFSSLEAQQQVGTKEEAEVRKLEFENNELRRRLTKTKQALEETLTQLTAANQRKKQVEKAICKQLHKTHHILKKARVNFDGPDIDSVE